jgi:hypothetical protein
MGNNGQSIALTKPGGSQMSAEQTPKEMSATISTTAAEESSTRAEKSFSKEDGFSLPITTDLPAMTVDLQATTEATDNDNWFIYFAQITVDRMLQRYGIATATKAEEKEPAPGNMQIAA